jgi:hypothetical protein
MNTKISAKRCRDFANMLNVLAADGQDVDVLPVAVGAVMGALAAVIEERPEVLTVVNNALAVFGLRVSRIAGKTEEEKKT